MEDICDGSVIEEGIEDSHLQSDLAGSVNDIDHYIKNIESALAQAEGDQFLLNPLRSPDEQKDMTQDDLIERKMNHLMAEVQEVIIEKNSNLENEDSMEGTSKFNESLVQSVNTQPLRDPGVFEIRVEETDDNLE